MEYCKECRQLGAQPFMYSQFCFRYQKFAEQERATMHIPRKPGDRIEVDWAGDKLYIVDRDTGEAILLFLSPEGRNIQLFTCQFHSSDLSAISL
jgi:hypothetical protein